MVIKELALKKLTVLTKPIGQKKPEWEHKAVMRSLIDGLNKNKVPYNYNPTNIEDIADIVIIPAYNSVLPQAIKMKRDGKIQLLLVGPNYEPKQLNFPEIDAILQPSQQCIRYLTETSPELSSKCYIWYAGIDPNYWYQAANEYLSSKNVLVYWKTEGENFCTDVESILKKHCWNPIKIRYGYYSTAEYKQKLENCRFAVFLSRSESQGLALAECWSMNIPTLIWNPMNQIVFEKQVDYFSACPYLTNQTGIAWKSIADLEKILSCIDTLLPTYSPRKWILDNMTDELSVKLLILIINTVLSKKNTQNDAQ